MAHNLSDAVFKFFQIVTHQQTDQPRWVWRSWPHQVWRITPSHSACRSICFKWNFLSKFIDSILVFSHTVTLGYSCIVVVCKYRNWVLEIENRTESNRIWKIQTDPALQKRNIFWHKCKTKWVMYSEQNDYGTHAAVMPLHWTYQKLVCSVPHCRDMHEWIQQRITDAGV